MYWLGLISGAALAALSHTTTVAPDAPRNVSFHHKTPLKFVPVNCDTRSCRDA